MDTSAWNANDENMSLFYFETIVEKTFPFINMRVSSGSNDNDSENSFSFDTIENITIMCHPTEVERIHYYQDAFKLME
jgi:hypothetical protein